MTRVTENSGDDEGESQVVIVNEIIVNSTPTALGVDLIFTDVSRLWAIVLSAEAEG